VSPLTRVWRRIQGPRWSGLWWYTSDLASHCQEDQLVAGSRDSGQPQLSSHSNSRNACLALSFFRNPV